MFSELILFDEVRDMLEDFYRDQHLPPSVMEAKVAEFMRDFDADGDGTVSLAEFKAGVQKGLA